MDKTMSQRRTQPPFFPGAWLNIIRAHAGHWKDHRGF